MSSSKQQQQPTPTSAAKSTIRSRHRRLESSPHAEPSKAAVPPDAAEEPAESPEAEDNANLSSSFFTADQHSPKPPTQPDASLTADQASPQAAVSAADVAMQDAVTPRRPAELKSPCTVPQQHGLPPIPHNLPSSPMKSDTDMANVANVVISATVSTILEQPDAAQAAQGTRTVSDVCAAGHNISACENSSQEGSRRSSGHSNNHQAAVHARKHLDWGAA